MYKYVELEQRLLEISKKAIKKEDFELSISALTALAKLAYEYNQFYTSDIIEGEIVNLANRIYEKKEYILNNENTIVFYDTFGFDTRGLALIYIKGLLELGYKVVYITDIDKKDKQVEMKKIAEGKNIIWEYIDFSKEYFLQMEKLFSYIKKYCPQKIFIYNNPYDVAGAIVFAKIEGVVRYKINLTDHAFWIGINEFDYIIEFRDYGASISRDKRKITTDKILKLPYYPYINYNKSFLGFDFIKELENKKIVLSGGAIYKTISMDNYYYRIISHILENHEDVIFIYAGMQGSGDESRLHALIEKYKGRVYYINERSDLYQMMKHSYLYINTYPLSGGLMIQYAVAAGVIPMTLIHDEATTGTLINEKDAFFYHNDIDAYLLQLDRILFDEKLKESLEKDLDKFLISDVDFNNALKAIIDNGSSIYCIELKLIDDSKFISQYHNRYSIQTVQLAIATKRNFALMKYFPFVFGGRLFSGVIRRIKRFIKNKNHK